MLVVSEKHRAIHQVVIVIEINSENRKRNDYLRFAY